VRESGSRYPTPHAPVGRVHAPVASTTPACSAPFKEALGPSSELSLWPRAGVPVTRVVPRPADVLWTIPVELGFYVLVPIVFAPRLVQHRLVGIVVAASFLASVVLAYYAAPALHGRGTPAMGLLHATAAPYFWIFLAGAAAALYWRSISRFFDGRVLWWLLAYAAICEADWLIKGTMMFQYRAPDALTVPRALILAGVVVSLAHSFPALSRWLRGVDLSYGLYLFHLPLIYGLHFAGFGGSIWLVILSLVAALALAAFSWVVVEKPALSLKPGSASSRVPRRFR